MTQKPPVISGLMHSCPVDGSSDFNLVYRNKQKTKEFSVASCKKCGLEMVNPQPSASVLSRYYDVNYYGNGSMKFPPIIQWLRKISIIKKVRKILSLYEHEKGRIMDIGCADGAFLFNIKKREWNTTGLEISASAVREESFKDLDIIIGDITEHHFAEHSHNVITLWHVFEHLADPDIYLNEIRRIMTPEGLLVITLPNVASWQARWFGKDWFHRDIPRHLYHYSPETLQKLLIKYGFRIQKIEHLSLEYNPFGYIQSFYNKFLGDNNHFYNHLKNIRNEEDSSGGDRGGSIRFFGLLALLPFLVLPAIFLSVAEAMSKKGGTIKVYIRHE